MSHLQTEEVFSIRAAGGKADFKKGCDQREPARGYWSCSMQNKHWINKTASRWDFIPYLLPDLQGGAAGRNFTFLQHNSVLRPSAVLPWGDFSVCGVWLGARLLSPAQCFPSYLAQKPQELCPTSPGALSQPLRGSDFPRDGGLSISQDSRAVLEDATECLSTSGVQQGDWKAERGGFVWK